MSLSFPRAHKNPRSNDKYFTLENIISILFQRFSCNFLYFIACIFAQLEMHQHPRDLLARDVVSLFVVDNSRGSRDKYTFLGFKTRTASESERSDRWWQTNTWIEASDRQIGKSRATGLNFNVLRQRVQPGFAEHCPLSKGSCQFARFDLGRISAI